ncbi:unnamed protein product [Arctogadus glacialis]
MKPSYHIINVFVMPMIDTVKVPLPQHTTSHSLQVSLSPKHNGTENPNNVPVCLFFFPPPPLQIARLSHNGRGKSSLIPVSPLSPSLPLFIEWTSFIISHCFA